MWLPPEISIAGNSIPISSIFWVIGFFFALMLGLFHGRKRGFQVGEMIKIALVGFAGALVGGRLGHVHQYWDYFSVHPMEAFFLHEGGMMYLGGLYGGLVTGIIYCWKRYDLLKVLDLATPSICLGHTFGRIGCFFYGCCYGLEIGKDSLLPGVVFAGDLAARYPTQLYSAIGLGLMTIFLCWLYSFSRRPGFVFLSYLALYSMMRFSIEFLRDDERGTLFGVNFLSSSQTLSLATLGLLLLVFPIWYRKVKENS